MDQEEKLVNIEIGVTEVVPTALILALTRLLFL